MTTEQFLSAPQPNEDVFSANYHQWVNHNFPQLRKFYMHIPNELGRLSGETQDSYSRRLSRHMSMGVLPGAYDYLFQKPYVWWHELKMSGKGMGKNQLQLLPIWTAAGIVVELSDTPEKAVENTLKHCSQYLRV